MKIVLATHNQGKLKELAALFAPLNIELISAGQLNINSPEEPHETFIENALLKARHAAKQSGLPALADDAGLCIKAFGGKPGVQTAYYAQSLGYPADQGPAALLSQMKEIQDDTKRGAIILSTLVAVKNENDPDPLIATGRVNVQITKEERGADGFGYDPLMLLPELNKTFAELTPQDKNKNSHRGKSSQIMLELIKQYWL